MGWTKWGILKEKEERIRLKKLVLFWGSLLLLFLFLGKVLVLWIQEEEKPEPVVRQLQNVWVIEAASDQVKVFEDGQQKKYGYYQSDEEDRILAGRKQDQAELELRRIGELEIVKEQLADILLWDEQVAQITWKNQKIHGKLLAVTDTGVVLEQAGYYPFAENMKGYRLFGNLEMCTPKDLTIGYDFSDFVVDNGQICGILIARKEVMEYIRVLLKNSDFAGNYHEEITLTCDTDYVLESSDEKQSVESVWKAGQICTISKEDREKWKDRVKIRPLALTGKISLLNVERSTKQPAYRGTIELLFAEDGIVAVNELPFEEYLYSVVPSEMPASYPAEALKAQAICARTYGYRYLLQAGYPQYGAHVDDSTTYQVYNNIAEQEAATAAVKDTYGLVLVDPGTGQPADTYYYSTSCGIGSDADVWSIEEGKSPEYLKPMPINRQAVENATEGTLLDEQGTLPGEQGTSTGAEGTLSGESVQLADYLQQEAAFEGFITQKNESDFEASHGWYRWTYQVKELNVDLLCERLQARQKAAPEKVLVQAKDGTFREGKVADFQKIKGMKVTQRGAGGVAAQLVIETEKGCYKVYTEYNIRYVLCDPSVKVVKQDGSESSVPTLLPSGFFILNCKNDMAVDKDISLREKESTSESKMREDSGAVTGYELIGGGYGHGVGMSQNGAGSMAEAGMNATQIVSFFYQGCEIQNVQG